MEFLYWFYRSLSGNDAKAATAAIHAGADATSPNRKREDGKGGARSGEGLQRNSLQHVETRLQG